MAKLAVVAAVVAFSRIAAADPHAQYLIDRGHAEKAPSMKGEYIDPCDQPGKERRYWKPSANRDVEEARLALQRYRNVMSCKSIKVDHVPAADLENDYEAALKQGDTKEAKRLARELHVSAMAVRVDRAFVQARLVEMAKLTTSTKIPAPSRPKLRALFADAERELAAGRIGSANLILNHLLVKTLDVYEP